MSPRHRSLPRGAVRMRPVNGLSLDNTYLELALMLEEIQVPAPNPHVNYYTQCARHIFVASVLRLARGAKEDVVSCCVQIPPVARRRLERCQMIKLAVKYVKKEEEQTLRQWLSELNRRRDEVLETFSQEGTRHEQAYLAEIAGRTVLIHIMDMQDPEHSQSV